MRPRRKPIDTSLEDTKKVLSEIDPEVTRIKLICAVEIHNLFLSSLAILIKLILHYQRS